MPLTEEEAAELERLSKKKDEPDTPASTHQIVENRNYTIDLDNEDQVKRAVRAGLLPASYLEDDDPDADDDDPPDDDAPRRRVRYE